MNGESFELTEKSPFMLGRSKNATAFSGSLLDAALSLLIGVFCRPPRIGDPVPIVD